MKRCILDSTNQTRWFDQDSAKRFVEATYFNGSNHISIATNSQWDHETLYLTRRGAWILHSWSQWQRTRDTYVEIEKEKAHSWLLRNGHEVPEEFLGSTEV
jgi:hypothetical protein